jgi:hypothetical protein
LVDSVIETLFASVWMLPALGSSEEEALPPAPVLPFELAFFGGVC